MPSDPTRIVVDQPFCGAAEPPVAVGERALVAGIAGAAPGDATLHAIDVAAGRVAWATTFPSDEHARDLATSLPLPRRDGGAWLAVHQFDGGVVIHGVDGNGGIDARIDLPCFGFEPRISDRWLTVASAVVVEDQLVLREGRSLWIVPAPGDGF